MLPIVNNQYRSLAIISVGENLLDDYKTLQKIDIEDVMS